MSKLASHLVLIKIDEPKQQDDDGIFIQEEWVSNQPTGTVERVAEDVTFCKAGDRVFFERYASIPTPHGKEYRMCKEDYIFEVLDA